MFFLFFCSDRVDAVVAAAAVRMSMFLGRHMGWWGDTIALGLLVLVALVILFALIGVYARRVWALPQHASKD